MKKLLLLLSLFVWTVWLVNAQSALSIRPNKTDFNNFLIMADHFSWEVADLSFSDFERNVVIETIHYRNQFGEMIPEASSGEKMKLLQYEPEGKEYSFFPKGENEDSYAIKLDEWDKFKRYSGTDRKLKEVYVLSVQNESVQIYYDSGAYKDSYNVEIDNKKRIKRKFYDFEREYTYGLGNTITAVTDRIKIILKTYTECTELQKIGSDTWIFKAENSITGSKSAKITVLERNEKGLWTRLVIEYMRDQKQNVDPVKMEKIRYFDLEESIDGTVDRPQEMNEEKQACAEENVKDLVIEDIEVDELEEGGEIYPFDLVTTKPTFNGGGGSEFSKWVNSRLVYPEPAKEKGVQGKVSLEFIINENGSISDVRVLEGKDPTLSAEALRVVNSSPKWKPGREADRPVKVSYQHTVVFQLR